MRPTTSDWRLATILLLLATACRQDMHDTPRYEAYESSAFFKDGLSSRPLVAGTIARGHLQDDEVFHTGKLAGVHATVFPVTLTNQVLDRGQQRFDVFCTPCHGRVGDGDGMITRRGFRPPPSLHNERLRAAAAGYLFEVMSRGVGVMPGYAAQIEPGDRWAIAAYIRALQLSQRATLDDVPAGQRDKLN